MRLRVLGWSGSGVPGRGLSSYLLDDSILFDAGGLTGALDIKRQLRIRDVFITHCHLDHIQGIPFLADNIFIAGKGGINVFSSAVILGKFKKHILNGSIWPDFSSIRRAGRPAIMLKALREGAPVSAGKYEITAFRMRHTTPAVGYLARHTGTGKNFFYTGDTGPGSGVWKKLGGMTLDCLITEVSFPNSMEKEAVQTGHLTPRLLAGELSQLDSPPRRIYIVHQKAAFYRTIIREAGRLNLDKPGVVSDGQLIRI
ncbi:MAG: 3',5'-cyclic-nucleotide phosphodiesterase [Nitrospiraceae bacterium]|nr:3',5'-cyclic-nucleotide phosphodiesterase [Nitrospiraceae bacterium]